MLVHSPLPPQSSLEDGSRQSKQGLVYMGQLSPHANNMGTSGISVICYFFVASKLPTDFSVPQSWLRGGCVLSLSLVD